jgi:hypothetical protein
MANQINNAQTVELGQAVARKFFAQLEINKLNAAKSIFSYPHGLSPSSF